MNDPRMSYGARYKARLMAPTFVVAAVVCAIERQWGLAALTFGAAILFAAYVVSGRRQGEN
jgi:hypothetical protein